MPNNPHLRYKSDVFISKPVTVELPAADWIALMTWLMKTDLDGVTYIAYRISEQVGDAVYTKESLKAADAAFNHHQEEQNPFTQAARAMANMTVPNPEEFTTRGASLFDPDEIWIIVCDICGNRDEYGPIPPGTPQGALTCGHDGPRHVAEITIRRED